MELIDQVIKALECCVNQNCVCSECPYLRRGCRHMKEDALTVLKESRSLASTTETIRETGGNKKEEEYPI